MMICASTVCSLGLPFTAVPKQRRDLGFFLFADTVGERRGGRCLFWRKTCCCFSLLFEIELVPFYLLISIWGGKTKREYAGY